MLDTMTATKVVGGFCGMLLIFLLGNWAAETIYGQGEGGHGDHEEQAYVIDTGDDEGHGASDGDDEDADEDGPDFAAALADADAGEGEKLWRACQSCHKLEDGANGVGPPLFGVVGRAVDSVEDFNYSGSLAAVADIWTPENLSEFIENPKEFAPGTKMTYRGMRDVEDRANLIAYLESIGN